ncbi:MAG: hypothetical protein R3335_11440 [Anaerolineales bacterium]|nr:hypothetical protein [Anaerolineales bacterium]
MTARQEELIARELRGGRVTALDDDSWKLSIPPGPAGQYRLAQLDDYSFLPRNDFPQQLPLSLDVRARASHTDIPGTWGFGFWNDPFITDFGFAGGTRRLPVLPDTAWFFFASPENYLSLDDTIPASGELAVTFHSRKIPSLLLALAIPIAPLLFIGPVARVLRRAGKRIIHQSASDIRRSANGPFKQVTDWRNYSMKITHAEATFSVDGRLVHRTNVTPVEPLGLVIWIDNQYAAVPPEGGIAFGSLENKDESWIEITGLSIRSGGQEQGAEQLGQGHIGSPGYD